MLLFIALANAAGVALGGPGFAPQPVGVEGAINLAMLTLVHARAYPVFAVMFGYGLVQLARRQDGAGATPAQVRRVLVRRNAALVVFGFLHAALLYFGDFLAAYGPVGIVLVDGPSATRRACASGRALVVGPVASLSRGHRQRRRVPVALGLGRDRGDAVRLGAIAHCDHVCRVSAGSIG